MYSVSGGCGGKLLMTFLELEFFSLPPTLGETELLFKLPAVNIGKKSYLCQCLPKWRKMFAFRMQCS